MKTIISSRELAIKWWNSLTAPVKINKTVDYFGAGYKHYSDLSDKEIEQIYLQQ